MIEVNKKMMKPWTLSGPLLAYVDKHEALCCFTAPMLPCSQPL